MILQKRDIEILHWINGFGFASVKQIKDFMQVKTTAAHVRIKKLVDDGYLKKDRILHGQAKVHKLTPKGRMICEDALYHLTDINLGTFRHDYLLIDLAIYLERKTGGSFIPPRRIRHNEGLSGVGQIGHIPDGYLIIGEDKPIAIELELSVKAHARIKDIIHGYGGDLSVKEVWYYTDRKDVAKAVSKVADGYDFIKIMDLPQGMGASV